MYTLYLYFRVISNECTHCVYIGFDKTFWSLCLIVFLLISARVTIDFNYFGHDLVKVSYVFGTHLWGKRQPKLLDAIHQFFKIFRLVDVSQMWPDLGKPTFWAYLPSGIITTVSPSKKELYVSNFTATKLNICFIKMYNKNWHWKTIWKVWLLCPEACFVPTR